MTLAMSRLIPTVVATAVLATMAGCGHPTKPSLLDPDTLNAQLSPASVVPPVTGTEAQGTGFVVISLLVTRDSAGTITSASADFQVTLSNFPGGTALTAAHIHQGDVGVEGPLIVDTGLQPGEVVLATGAGTFTKQAVPLTAILAQQLLSTPAQFYFDVHSSLNPSGILRAQLLHQ